MMIYTSGSIGAGWRLKFEATPPEADFPEKQVRLSDAEIAATDASYGPDGKPLELQLETGKKTVVDMELDMTGFSGESAVYAIRVPTNYIASGAGPSGDLKPEQVWFLLAGEKPAG